MRTLLIGTLLALAVPAPAQDPVDVAQTIRDLSTTGVLMDISAHPDDEDGATLAYYRMKHGVHTYSVLFTRGEGGQNEKGSELYEDLGVIRSAETRAAGEILGAEVEFLNFPDFGYSKTATEAFRIWGGQREVLRRLVYVIRRVRPDVLFSNHNTWGGHGHHQAVAITAIAAFDAAADSAMFPEQLREPGVTLWQPKKLYLRVFGSPQSPEAADVTHLLEEVNDIRGVAYIDIATTALRKHRTQGLDRADLRRFGRGRSAYRLARASSLFQSDTTNFFGGVGSWSEWPLSSLRNIAARLQLLSPRQSWDSLVSAVSTLLPSVDSLAHTPAGLAPYGSRILARWRERLEHLAATAAGVDGGVALHDSVLVPGQRVAVTISPTSRRGRLSIDSIAWSLPAGWSVQVSDEAVQKSTLNFTLKAGDRPRFTLPKADHLYRSIEDGTSCAAHISYRIDGYPLTLESPCTPDVAAPHLLQTAPEVVWAQPENAVLGISFACRVTNMFPHKTAGTVALIVPAGWRGSGLTFALEHEGETDEGQIHVVAPAGVAGGEYILRLRTDYAERAVTVRLAHVAVPAELRVGLVSSYDSTLATAMRELQVSCDTLTDAALTGADLHIYNTIIIDMRAYLVRDVLKLQNNRLLEYVRNGGNLLVMYQREGEWKPEYAPYPFSISRQRVTMEDAPVNMLQPSHPLLTWPNPIAPGDWDGWKQERAVYLPVGVPPQYDRLVSTHDPDEPEGDTGYLCASVGRGSYIYTTFVWYRQLKDRHPGALRCLANMLAYPLRPR